MKLYEIDKSIEQAIEAAVDPETGEIISEEAYAYLESLQMEFEKKTEGILLAIKNLRSDAEDLKKEKMAFAERQSAAEKRAASLEKYIAGILNGQKFSTTKVAVAWRKSTSVEFSGDVRSLPPEFIREKEHEINKTALKEVLKNGVEIPGATLVTKNNMQIK